MSLVISVATAMLIGELGIRKDSRYWRALVLTYWDGVIPQSSAATVISFHSASVKRMVLLMPVVDRRGLRPAPSRLPPLGIK